MSQSNSTKLSNGICWPILHSGLSWNQANKIVGIGCTACYPVNIALYNLLDKLDQWDLLSLYVHHFHLPKPVSNIKLAPLFESKRLAKDKKHKKIIATASELLTLCSIVAHYMREVCLPANACKGEVLAFLSLLETIDLLQATWHGTVASLQLLQAAESSLGQCVALCWKLIKKHHWLLHFHQMLSKHQCIPNTFCMERKNKIPGRIATLIQHLSNFDWSLYSEVVTLEVERLPDLEVFAIEPGLLHARPLAERLVPLAAEVWHSWNDVSGSNHSRVKHGLCSHGDMVYLTSHVWLWPSFCAFSATTLEMMWLCWICCTWRRCLTPLLDGKTEGAMKFFPCRDCSSQLWPLGAVDQNRSQVKLPFASWTLGGLCPQHDKPLVAQHHKPWGSNMNETIMRQDCQHQKHCLARDLKYMLHVRACPKSRHD